MAKSATSAEHHQGRAVRHWVSLPVFGAPPRPPFPYASCVPLTRSVSSAALCQVFDSIFMNLPMSRVKFNANTEYQYVQNFKILQSTFAAFNAWDRKEQDPASSLLRRVTPLQGNLY